MSRPEERTAASYAPVAGPGRLPSARTLIVGGGMLALVLGGYWYFNGKGGSGADKPSNAAPVRVALVQQRDMAGGGRRLGTGGAKTLGQLNPRGQGTLMGGHFKEGQF